MKKIYTLLMILLLPFTIIQTIEVKATDSSLSHFTKINSGDIYYCLDNESCSEADAIEFVENNKGSIELTYVVYAKTTSYYSCLIYASGSYSTGSFSANYLSNNANIGCYVIGTIKSAVAAVEYTCTDLNTICTYGHSVDVPKFTATKGNGVQDITSMAKWQKKNGSNWDDYYGVDHKSGFEEGTYRMQIQVRTEGTQYCLANSTTVKVNGVSWSTITDIVYYRDYSYDWSVSPEFTVTKTTTPTQYDITCTNATASVTKATKGTTVTITASAAPSGKVFDKWEVTGATVANVNASTTTFVMGESNVTVVAQYKDAPKIETTSYSITCTNATSSHSKAQKGTTVTITANTAPEGFEFDKWVFTGTTLANETSETTTFVMGESNVTIEAIYKQKTNTEEPKPQGDDKDKEIDIPGGNENPDIGENPIEPEKDNNTKYFIIGGVGVVAISAIAITVSIIRKKKEI